MGAESASGERAERMADSVIERHGPHPVAQHAGHTQHEVDGEDASGRGSYLGSEFVQFQTGHLGRIDVAVLHLVDGNQGKGEHHDAQAAHPLGETAPEAQTMGESVDVAHHGGACGGESAHSLEEGISDAHTRMEDERNHAHKGEDDPCQGHDEETVGTPQMSVCGIFPACHSQDGAQAERQQGTCQESGPVFFPVVERHHPCEQQEESFHDEQEPEYVLLHFSGTGCKACQG